MFSVKMARGQETYRQMQYFHTALVRVCLLKDLLYQKERKGKMEPSPHKCNLNAAKADGAQTLTAIFKTPSM